MSEPSAGRSTHLHSDWATRTSTSLHQWNNAPFLQDSGAFQSAITAHWHLSLVTSDERYTTPEEWPTLPPPKTAVYFLIDTLLRIKAWIAYPDLAQHNKAQQCRVFTLCCSTKRGKLRNCTEEKMASFAGCSAPDSAITSSSS